jgi:DNA helicase IV
MKFDENFCVFKSAEDHNFQELRNKCVNALKELTRRTHVRDKEDEEYRQVKKKWKKENLFWFLKAFPSFAFTYFSITPSYRSEFQIEKAIKSILLTIDSQPHEICLSCELVADIMFLSQQGSK